MGKAIVQAGFDEIANIAARWANGLCLTQSENNSSQNCEYKSNFYSVKYQCQQAATGTTVSINVRPRLCVFIVLHLLLLAGLCFCFSLISELVNNFSSRVFILILAAIGIASLIHLKDRVLPGRFSRIENSFWDKLSSEYDTDTQTRATGQMYSSVGRIFTELLLAGFLISTGQVVLGIVGSVVLGIVTSLFLIMILAESVGGDNPKWHWRLWIMGNMARWSYLMLAIMGIRVDAMVIIANIPWHTGPADTGRIARGGCP